MLKVHIEPGNMVYIILGVDENCHDQVIAVFGNYHDAKVYCAKNLVEPKGFYDLWIEKHRVK